VVLPWLLTVTTAAGFYICKHIIIITKKRPRKIYREIKSTQRIESTQKQEFGQAVLLGVAANMIDIAGGRSGHYDFVDPVAQAVQEGVS
jgi:uncharacterized protein with ATP-grasp and redox domains